MRTKMKYEARVKGRVRAEGRNVVIPITLDNDPGRQVEVKVPRSKVVPILRAAVAAAEKITALDAK